MMRRLNPGWSSREFIESSRVNDLYATQRSLNAPPFRASDLTANQYKLLMDANALDAFLRRAQDRRLAPGDKDVNDFVELVALDGRIAKALRATESFTMLQNHDEADQELFSQLHYSIKANNVSLFKALCFVTARKPNSIDELLKRKTIRADLFTALRDLPESEQAIFRERLFPKGDARPAEGDRGSFNRQNNTFMTSSQHLANKAPLPQKPRRRQKRFGVGSWTARKSQLPSA